MIKLVTNACFKDSYRVSSRHLFQLVRSKSSQNYGQRTQQGSDGKKTLIHFVIMI